jgi:L-ribulokinase
MLQVKFAIGIDFGTQSGRALLVNLVNGEELATHITPYAHGVIDQRLPYSNKELELDWALQHPADYLEVLHQSVPAVVYESGVNPKDIIGIGIDFTASTILPVDKDGTPLCLHERLRENQHSWVKLWKHHAAQAQADRLNEMARATDQSFLKRYGGKISSEWMIPKVMQVLEESPDIFEEADQFVEAADWIVHALTGRLLRNSCTAGYKALWHKREGYPSQSFFRQLDSRLAHVADTKLRGEVVPLGTKAGGLLPEMATAMGLVPGTAVAVGNIDAHAGVPGSGVVEPGKMVMAMGTSICHLIMDQDEKYVEGISGVVEDGIVPGLFAYEAGQAAVGDLFAWFIEQAVPSEVKEIAMKEGKDIHAWLEERASSYRPGETGLLALDWWNGNRSVLGDSDLSGLILGFSLQTKPEELYRALLEATAFGTRRIIDAFEAGGVAIQELYACGGLPRRNRLLMQIYADVTGRTIHVAASTQTTALGAAMFGAVAGADNGGYKSIVDAAKNMAKPSHEVFRPIPGHASLYNRLYQEYCQLHDYFGRGANPAMKVLRALKHTTQT